MEAELDIWLDEDGNLYIRYTDPHGSHLYAVDEGFECHWTDDGLYCKATVDVPEFIATLAHCMVDQMRREHQARTNIFT